MKNIGFLSFGHWSAAPGSQVKSASDSLLQSIDLAVAAEELGADGAYFRVHHFARQLGFRKAVAHLSAWLRMIVEDHASMAALQQKESSGQSGGASPDNGDAFAGGSVQAGTNRSAAAES